MVPSRLELPLASVPPEAAERHTNGVVAHLEAKAAADIDDNDDDPFAVELTTAQVNDAEQEEKGQQEQQGNGEAVEGQDEEETEEQGDEEEEAEEDSDEVRLLRVSLC